MLAIIVYLLATGYVFTDYMTEEYREYAWWAALGWAIIWPLSLVFMWASLFAVFLFVRK